MDCEVLHNGAWRQNWDNWWRLKNMTRSFEQKYRVFKGNLIFDEAYFPTSTLNYYYYFCASKHFEIMWLLVSTWHLEDLGIWNIKSVWHTDWYGQVYSIPVIVLCMQKKFFLNLPYNPFQWERHSVLNSCHSIFHTEREYLIQR